MSVGFRALFSAVALLGMFCARAEADSVADFYQGRLVQMIVGTGTGGGNDIYARVLARYLGAYIPGSPAVVVQNMPGAGGLSAANYLYSIAPKDGSVIGTFDRGVPLLAILGTSSNVRFDPQKFTWLGSPSSYADDAFLLFARKDAAVKTVEDARRPGGPKLIVGVTGDGATDKNIAILIRDVLGFNLNIVPGYPDGGAISLAVDRQEADARLLGLSAVYTSRPEWLQQDSQMHALIQFARITRHPRFPDVPTARELARDPVSLAIIQLAELPYQISRPFAAPPGIPPERAAALEAAFVKTTRDPGFLAEAAKLNLDVSPVDGKAVMKLIAALAGSPPDVLEKMKSLQSGRAAP
jgi:tripartite-type tricarboxylate transporter receptor subunit TctC